LEQAWYRNGQAVKQRWQTEGMDRNGAMMVLEFIDSDNEIYLTSFKQITM
jgi:hypothetical protein